jgi:predicted lipoprotein with Yx(FWY)xxD motif
MKRTRQLAGLLVAVTAAIVLAACGSSSSSSTTKHAAATTSSGYSVGSNASATTSNASASSVTVKTAKGKMGTYLVGPNGHALYLWVADKNGKSVCSGACAKIWPPLLTSGKASTSGGAMAADLGTVKRSDGKTQVTYKGHPLYYYITDTKPGMTTGQGSNNFGALWWLVAPSGQAITSSSSSSSSSSSTSTSGGGGWG